MTSAQGSRFYVLFVDKATHYIWIFLIQRKSQVQTVFIEFKNYIELQCNRKIRAIQTDNGGKFIALKPFLSDHGIAHWRSCLHIHQQMGSVERRHRHIMDIGLSLLDHAKLPLEFWYYAFTTATFLYNRIPSTTLSGDSPTGVCLVNSWIWVSGLPKHATIPPE